MKLIGLFHLWVAKRPIMKSIFLAFLAFLLSPELDDQGIDFINVSSLKKYQKMLNIARSKKLMLVVVVYTDNDAFQQMDDNDVFDDPKLEKAWLQFTLLSIYAHTEMGSRWIDLFPTQELPGFYFLGADEILYHTVANYQSSENLLIATQKAKSFKTTYPILKEKYSSHQLSIYEWNSLLQIQALNFAFHETLSLALEFLNSLDDNQLSSDMALPVLIRFGIDLETDYPQKIISNKKAIASKSESFDFSDFYKKAFNYNLDLAIENGDTVLLDKIFKILIPANPNTSVAAADLKLNTAILFAEETNSFSPWKNQAIQNAEWQKNDSLKAKYLFDQSFEIIDLYRSKDALHKARQLAARANSYHESFRYCILESYAVYLLKDYEKAKILVIKAIALCDNPNDLKKAKGLKNMIERELEEDR